MWKGNLASIFLSHPVFIIDKLLVVLVHYNGVDCRSETEIEELSWASCSVVGRCSLVDPCLLASENMMDCTEMKSSGF